MKSCRSLIGVAAIAVGVTAGLWAAESDRGVSLYERLGGMPAIRAVVDDLMVRILADARINQWFARAAADPERAAAYKANLADLVCQATGGPCKYAGMDMVTAHQGRGVTVEAFNSMVEDIAASLDKLKVPEKERQQLLGLLAPLKAAVVQR
jgi:hemoglobin